MKNSLRLKIIFQVMYSFDIWWTICLENFFAIICFKLISEINLYSRQLYSISCSPPNIYVDVDNRPQLFEGWITQSTR